MDSGPEADPDVLVIGAGLAGLAAAHEISRNGLRPLVLEREKEPGGRARSEQWEGCTIELGASFLTPEYRRLRRLIEECGLSERLEQLPNALRTAVRRNGRWHYFDPSRPELELVRYRGISWREKAALARLLPFQLRVATSLRFFDVASAAAVDSRTLEAVIGPGTNRHFASGLMELLCGYPPAEVSLVFGVLGGRYPLRRASILRGGLGTLTGELGRRLEVRCAVALDSVGVDGGGVVARTSEAATLRARAAILATPARVALALWPDAPAPARRFLGSQLYTQGLGVFLRTSAPVRRTDPRGRGVFIDIVPPDERTGALLAVLYMNELADDGGLIGLAASPEAVAAEPDDDALATRLESELAELHPDLRPPVTARRTLRWPLLVPSYPVGRARALADFRAGLAPGPIQLAGDYLYGPMMEAAVRAGQEAAARALEYVGSARDVEFGHARSTQG